MNQLRRQNERSRWQLNSSDVDSSLFVIWLVLGSISVVIGRLMATTLPWEYLIKFFTRFDSNRLATERSRISSELADYLGFGVWLVGAAFALMLASQVTTARSVRNTWKWIRGDRLRSPYLIYLTTFIQLAAINPAPNSTSIGPTFVGFGFGIALVATVAAIGAEQSHLKWLSEPRWWNSRRARLVIFVIAVALIVPQVLLPSTDLGYRRHDLIFLNELAATTVGLQPLKDFHPAYANLLIYPMSATKLFGLSGHTTLLVLTAYWDLLGFACWALILEIGRRVLRIPIAYATIIVVPLLSVSPSLLSLEPSFPTSGGNLRLPMSLLSLLLFIGLLDKTGRNRLRMTLLGICLGLTAANNVEFGMTMSLSIVLVMILTWRHSQDSDRTLVVFALTSSLLTFVIVITALSAGDFTAGVSDLLLFVSSKTYAGSVVSTPIFGLNQIALASHAIVLWMGIRAIREDASNSSQIVLGRFSMVAGFWGLATWPYFLGSHNHNFGNLLWVPFAFSWLALFGLIRAQLCRHVDSDSSGERSERLIDSRRLLVPLLATLICTCILLPSSAPNYKRLVNREVKFDRSSLLRDIGLVEEVRLAAATYGESVRIGYYGEYANLIQILTDVPSVYGTHDPMIAYYTSRTVRATCKTLESRQPNKVIASTKYLPEEFRTSESLRGPCPGLIRTDQLPGIGLLEFEYHSLD